MPRKEQAALFGRASKENQDLLGRMSMTSKSNLFQRASVSEQGSMLQRLSSNDAADLYGKASVDRQMAR